SSFAEQQRNRIGYCASLVLTSSGLNPMSPTTRRSASISRRMRTSSASTRRSAAFPQRTSLRSARLSIRRQSGQLDEMRRRTFITLLGSAAAAWPLGALAQEPARSRKVGVLHPGQSTNVSARVVAIREGLSGPGNLRDLNVEVVIRLADGDLSRLPALAADLVNNHVDAIMSATNRRPSDAKKSSDDFPIP